MNRLKSEIDKLEWERSDLLWKLDEMDGQYQDWCNNKLKLDMKVYFEEKDKVKGELKLVEEKIKRISKGI